MIPRIKPTDVSGSGNVVQLGDESFGKVKAKLLPSRQLSILEDKIAKVAVILSPFQSASQNTTSVRLNRSIEE